MIKVHYDKLTTLVKGYYPDSINYSSIPEPHIEIKEEDQIFNKQMCVIDGIYQEYVKSKEIILQEAKEAKIAQLKINYEQETIRPHILTNVVKIDKLNKPISLCNSYFKIINSESLTDSVNIIFAGSFMMIRAFLTILCQESGKNYQDIIKKVFDLSRNTNPAIAASANIPYTSKDDKGEEVRILLSLQNIEEIFTHLFSRIATTSAKYNEIEIKIKNANSLTELDNININF